MRGSMYMVRACSHLRVLLLYTLLTILLYAPNLPTFSTRSIGHPASNSEKEIRGMWDGMNSILEHGYVSSKVTTMNFPDGGRLFSLQQGGQWLGMLFRPFLGVVAIHNILYLLNTLLAALGAMLLARELSGRDTAAVVAGAIYAFAPAALAFPVVSGVTETSFLFPLPFVLLFSIRSLSHRSLWNPVLAAFFLVLQTFVCWSYGVAAAILLLLLLVLLVAGHGRSWAVTSPFLRGARLDRALFLRFGLFLVIGAAISIPVFLLVIDAHSGQGAVYDRPLSLWPWLAREGTHRSFMMNRTRLTIASYLVPGRANLVGPFPEDLDWLVYSSYAGWIALLLVLRAVWKRCPGWLFLSVSMGTFLLLSLGPQISLGIGGGRGAIPNPVYLSFWYGFPAFSLTANSPDRFNIPFQLLLAIAAAGGLATLTSSARLSDRNRWLVSAALSLLIVLETMLVSPVPWPFPQTLSTPTAASLWLRDHEVPGAVLDLPLTIPADCGNFQRGDVFMQQVYHGRSIPYNYRGVSDSLSRDRFFRRLTARSHPRGAAPEDLRRFCHEATSLRKMGFAFLVYRPHLDPPLFERTRHLLEACFGPPVEIDDASIYALSAAGNRTP